MTHSSSENVSLPSARTIDENPVERMAPPRMTIAYGTA